MAGSTWRTVAILSIAIVLGVFCQIIAPSDRVAAAAGFAFAGAVFAIGIGRENDVLPAAREDDMVSERPMLRAPALRAAGLAVSVVLLRLAWAGFASNRFSAYGVASWTAGFGCFLIAVWCRPVDRRSAPPAVRRVRLHHVLLLAVVVLAIVFRFALLEQVPGEMTSDHAEKLLDVRDVLDGARPIYFGRNTGREALQFYLTAALIRWTPLELGHLALKVGTGIFGVVAVLFTFLLGRELYNRWIGLLAAALLAVSHWHVAITRVGLRFPFTAAFATPALYFLFRAFRCNRRRDWILAGAFLGIGLHSYTPMRIVPLLLVALCVVKLGVDLGGRRRGRSHSGSSLDRGFWVNAAVGAATSVILFLPLLRYMHDQPDMFWLRAASRAIPDAMSLPEAGALFVHNTLRAAMMFSFIGDRAPVNSILDSPVLGWVTGALFVLGLAALANSAVRGRDPRPAYLVVALLVLLLPSTLSLAFPGENPSVVRTGGAPPVVMIIAALPLFAWSVIAHRAASAVGPRAARLTVAAGMTAALCGAAAYNAQWYFVRYRRQYDEWTWNTSDMGRIIRDWVARGGELEHAYHVPHPFWADTRLIALHAGDFTWHNDLLQPETLASEAGSGEARLFLLHPKDAADLAILERLFPRGSARIEPSSYPGLGKEFVVFEVPPAPSVSADRPDRPRDPRPDDRRAE